MANRLNGSSNRHNGLNGNGHNDSPNGQVDSAIEWSDLSVERRLRTYRATPEQIEERLDTRRRSNNHVVRDRLMREFNFRYPEADWWLTRSSQNYEQAWLRITRALEHISRKAARRGTDPDIRDTRLLRQIKQDAKDFDEFREEYLINWVNHLTGIMPGRIIALQDDYVDDNGEAVRWDYENLLVFITDQVERHRHIYDRPRPNQQPPHGGEGEKDDMPDAKDDADEEPVRRTAPQGTGPRQTTTSTTASGAGASIASSTSRPSPAGSSPSPTPASRSSEDSLGNSMALVDVIGSWAWVQDFMRRTGASQAAALRFARRPGWRSLTPEEGATAYEARRSIDEERRSSEEEPRSSAELSRSLMSFGSDRSTGSAGGVMQSIETDPSSSGNVGQSTGAEQPLNSNRAATTSNETQSTSSGEMDMDANSPTADADRAAADRAMLEHL